MTARVRIARGARACEQALLHDLDELCAATAHDPSALRAPIRIIVPSTSLRHHLTARIVAHAGRAVAGVAVHTLYGFARFVLDAEGQPSPPGSALFPLLVHQAAQQEKALGALEELHDGYAGLVGTVTDLLDAGFEGAHADAIDELLLQLSLPAHLHARVHAVVHVAARTLDRMNGLGVARQSAVFSRARDIVNRNSRAVRARALLIHGFADATGIASDFIESLLGAAGGRIYLDQPADLATPDGSTAGAAFVQRFTERVSGLGTVEHPGDSSPSPQLALLRARGAEGEARAVADRVRTLLDGGVGPESIGVVARNISPYVVPLRLHFGRLGIPFSALDVRAPFDATQRQIRALVAVMQQREASPAERWISALGSAPGAPRTDDWPTWRTDMHGALHTLNAARVGDVIALAPLTTDDNAPRSGSAEVGDIPDARVASSKQVADARRLLARAPIARAAALLAHGWKEWPRRAPFNAHAQHFAALLAGAFLWPSNAAAELFSATLHPLADELPATLPLSYEDFLTLIAEAFTRVRPTEVSGHGAGIQVLDVTAARARTFSHLFILGLNRDAFPRTIVEDPLVPDSVRRALAALLPDLPIKHVGFDEERYLFAQLLSSSAHVTVSWQFVSDDGSAMSPSPLVDRLRLRHRHLAVETVPSLYSPPASTPQAQPDADLPLFSHLAAKPLPLRPAHEYAVLAGLYGTREDVAAALQVALSMQPRDTRVALSTGDAARVRLAVIDEHEGRPWLGQDDLGGLGPYYGFVGAPRASTDPRHAKLFITTIESMARCPWRTFIRRVLGVQPLPDALESLPAVTALMLGNIVHRVLDRIIRDAVPDAPIILDSAAAPTPTHVAWPPAPVVQRILEREATLLAEESGIALPGLVTLMVRHARAYLTQAERQDWPHPAVTVPVVGSEITGTVQVDQGGGTPRTVYFKADRVDATSAGLRLTDYKTGRVMREALLTNVANGTHLQCAAYALSSGHPGDEGRYLYLRPDADDARRSVIVPTAATDLVQAFHAAVGIVLNIWESGAFFPRVAEPSGSEFGDCRFCEVRDACLRNDPEYRGRLQRWIGGGRRQAGAAPSDAERALHDGWRLRTKSDAASDTRSEVTE